MCACVHVCVCVRARPPFLPPSFSLSLSHTNQIPGVAAALIDTVEVKAPMDEEKTLALESICKADKGQVSRGNGQSCCQVC
jgi:hypothetical protein